MLIYGADRELKLWAGERLGIRDFGPSVAIGVAHKGEIVAAAVFNNYHPPSIQITFATTTPRWASRVAIRSILKYPFSQLECLRITAITKTGNVQSRGFLERLGFKQEGIIRCAFHDSDAILYGILRQEAARWL